MKIFVVYAKVELTEKPSWLDEFRRRYDDPLEFHITLKQPCFIEDDQEVDIKNKLDNLFNIMEENKDGVTVVFDSINADPDAPDGGCIMINANDTTQIAKLQYEVVSALPGYNRYYLDKYEEYEKTFIPHLTIARKLSAPKFIEAQNEIQEDFVCKGIVKKVVLVTVNNYGSVEAMDPKNQTVYQI